MNFHEIFQSASRSLAVFHFHLTVGKRQHAFRHTLVGLAVPGKALVPVSQVANFQSEAGMVTRASVSLARRVSE